MNMIKKIVSIRMSDDVKKELQERAEKEYRTFTNYIEKVLLEHLKEIKNK